MGVVLFGFLVCPNPLTGRAGELLQRELSLCDSSHFAWSPRRLDRRSSSHLGGGLRGFRRRDAPCSKSTRSPHRNAVAGQRRLSSCYAAGLKASASPVVGLTSKASRGALSAKRSASCAGVRKST